MSPAHISDPIRGVLAEVAEERLAQNAKWGEQNHPDGTGYKLDLPGFAADVQRDRFRDVIDEDAREGRLTWMGILTEEVLEVNAETNPAAIRRELIQVAAVAVAHIEAIDRRLARAAE